MSTPRSSGPCIRERIQTKKDLIETQQPPSSPQPPSCPGAFILEVGRVGRPEAARSDGSNAGLPTDARSDDVNKLFDGFGRIVDCRVMTGEYLCHTRCQRIG